MLTVLNEYTREALCVVVRSKMNGEDVLDALYPLRLKREKPEYIRSENGPEFVASSRQNWLSKVGVKPIQIHHGFTPLSDCMQSPAGQRMGERLKRTLQRHSTPRNVECELVQHHRTGTDRHQHLAQAIQPCPPTLCARFATTRARNLMRESPNQRPKLRG